MTPWRSLAEIEAGRADVCEDSGRELAFYGRQGGRPAHHVVTLLPAVKGGTELVFAALEPTRAPTPHEAHHAMTLRNEARALPSYRRPLIIRLRVLHRLLVGAWTEEQALALGGVTEDLDELRMLLHDEVHEAPRVLEGIFWAGEKPEEPTVIAQARRMVEAETARLNHLTRALSWRLAVAAGRATPEQAAADLGMALTAWKGFCAVEEARPCHEDRSTADPGVLDQQ